MKKNCSENDRELLKKVNGLLMIDSHAMCCLDEDDDLMIKVFFSPEAFASCLIACSKYGYNIRMCFHIGDSKHKYVLTKKANELNDRMREGSFFIDEDCELNWKNFLPYSDSIDEYDIIRSYKMGIETFLCSVSEFVEVMEEDVAEDGTVVIEVEDAA